MYFVYFANMYMSSDNQHGFRHQLNKGLHKWWIDLPMNQNQLEYF